jgi:pimeloyl-[acyl-carrier protein] methyl ester esterase
MLHIKVIGTGKPLVLLHGFGFSHEIFLNLASLLKDDYALYLVDLPGFGLSSLMPWDDFKIKLLAQLPPVFAVMGWSMGGLMAMRLAIEHPERVSYLFSIASSPRLIKGLGWPGIDASVFYEFSEKVALDSKKTLTQFIQIQHPSLNDEHSLTKPYHTSDFALKSSLDILLHWDLRDALRLYPGKAAFVFGRLDSITPRTTLNAMKRHYPQFEYYLFEKAAHMPFLSHSEEFVDWLSEVL